MAVGRHRPEQDPGSGSGISIGGSNNAPLQNVVGQNISNVHQTASVQGTVDIAAVREILASFRSSLAQNESTLRNVTILRVMADTVDTSLETPETQVGAMRSIAAALPPLVVGTVVEQGGQLLAHAINALLS
jgi:hypothetical protein